MVSRCRQLWKMEDHSRKVNAGTDGLEAGTGKTGVEAAWVRKAMKPSRPTTMEAL